MTIQDAAAHMLAPTGQSGNDGMPTNSMPILQPVFIPRQTGDMFQQANGPNSPGSLAATASADWAFMLRNAAAMTSGGNGTPTLDMGHLAGSSPNNIQDFVNGRRSSPQIHSSPNVLYSPMTSTAPNNLFNSSSMVDFAGGVGADALGGADPNMLAAMQLSNNSNLSSSLSAAAAAMYGNDTGVQTLYGSTSQLALAAAGAAAARQTQTLLQQQQAAVNSLNSGLSNMGLAGGMGNGLGKIEESLSGNLFSAVAAAAAAAAGQAAQKPVSSSLYIKVSTDDVVCFIAHLLGQCTPSSCRRVAADRFQKHWNIRHCKHGRLSDGKHCSVLLPAMCSETSIYIKATSSPEPVAIVCVAELAP